MRVWHALGYALQMNVHMQEDTLDNEIVICKDLSQLGPLMACQYNRMAVSAYCYAPTCQLKLSHGLFVCL